MGGEETTMPKTKASLKKLRLEEEIDLYCKEVAEVLTKINTRIRETEAKKQKRKRKKSPVLVGAE